jgi:DNA polymerase-4
MPTVRAERLCPEAIFVPPDFPRYRAVSREVREIFKRFTDLIEPLSLDEAYLDVTVNKAGLPTATRVAQTIREQIRTELSLTASAGVAPNKFLAKIASDIDKPDGMVVVAPGTEQQFLDPLPIGRLWGVGRVTGGVFERLGIATIGQLRALPQESLKDLAGQVGVRLWELAHGIDDRKVIPDRDAKTISHESTFASDITDLEMLRAWLLDLTEQVGRRLRRHELSGRTVHLKIRLADFQTVTRARTLPRPTNVTQELWEAAAELLTLYAEGKKLSIRLLGMGVSGLQADPLLQQQLFDNEDHHKQGQLDAVADAIQSRFGGAAIRRGSRLFRDNA